MSEMKNRHAAQPVAPIADWEEIGTVLASVADNLGDMPISDEWAAKTAKRAWSLLERNNYFRAAQPVAGEPVAPYGWVYELWVEGQLVGCSPIMSEQVDLDLPFGEAGVDHGGSVVEVPLYTAAPAPVGLVPLTEGQIDALRLQCGYGAGMDRFSMIVSAIEVAHGIKHPEA